MNFTWRSRSHIDVPQVKWHQSATFPDVRFSIRQISLGSRLELMNAMRDLVAKNEFLRAGDMLDQTEAVIADLKARSVYLRWGLCELNGLTIGGKLADASALIADGPEILCNEIVAVIRDSLELSEAERKNF